MTENRIQASSRLVQNHQFGIMDDSDRHRYSSALSTAVKIISNQIKDFL